MYLSTATRSVAKHEVPFFGRQGDRAVARHSRDRPPHAIFHGEVRVRLYVERVERRLSAVLVADLVGYTEHMHGAETTTYQQVKSDLSTIFEPRIAAHRGRIVKTMGDGILAEFASVIDCIECAMDIQPTLAGRGGADSSDFA